MIPRPSRTDAAADRTTPRDATSDALESGSRDASAAPDVGRESAAPADVGTAIEAAIDAGSEAATVVDASPDPSPTADAAADAPASFDDVVVPDLDTGADAAPLGLRLVGYWKFDEPNGTAAVDSSGNGNDGTLTAGATFVAGAAPATQYANAGSLQVDGTGGTAVLGANGLPPVDAPKTISLWVNYPAIPAANMTILALTNSTQACGVQVGLRGGNVAISSWGGATLVNNAGAPPAGAWHHVIYTFDGTTNSLYVDGAAPVTRANAPQSCPTIENVVGTWATHAPPYDEFYAGMIDDLRIYSGVLGPAQMAVLIAGGDPSLIPADAGLEASVDAAPSVADAAAEAATDAGSGTSDAAPDAAADAAADGGGDAADGGAADGGAG